MRLEESEVNQEKSKNASCGDLIMLLWWLQGKETPHEIEHRNH